MADSYAEEFIRKQHEKEKAEQAQRDRENAEARRSWEAKLEAERLADLKKTQDALDEALEPDYRRQRAEWQVSNPGRPVAEFDALWAAHMRPVLVEDLKEARIRREVEHLAASGKYRI